MAETTSTTVASAIEKRISTIVTNVLIQESVALPTVTDRTSEVGPGIDRLDINLFTELAVQDVLEAGAMTAQTINPGAAQLALDRHKAIPFSISRRAGQQSKIALVPEALRNGARTLAAEIDDHIFSLIDANASTGAPDHRLPLTASQPLTDLANAKKLLDDQNVPKSQRFVAASPGFVQSLLGDSNVINVDKYGAEDPIMNGFVTRVYGFNLVESSSASIVNDGFQAYHKETISFARQIMPEIRQEEKALEMRDDWVLSHLYGAIASDSSGVRAVVYDADGL